jgi:hypothetical protein
MPLWGKDGRHLYYLDPLSTLMAVDVDLGKDLVRIRQPVPLLQTRCSNVDRRRLRRNPRRTFSPRQFHDRKCHTVDSGCQLGTRVEENKPPNSFEEDWFEQCFPFEAHHSCCSLPGSLVNLR